MINLSQADIYKKCQIIKLDTDPSITKRFIDIGLIPGITIEKVLISPFGNISAYSIMGSTIAIRDKDIEGVIVEYV